MYSDNDNRRCRRLGSPIRTSPDHGLCAPPRSFSQLTTSFFAYLRLGIPTHALSSLTIKSISDTEHSTLAPYPRHTHLPPCFAERLQPRMGELMYAHLPIQFSKIELPLAISAANRNSGLVGRAEHRVRPKAKSQKTLSGDNPGAEWTGKAAAYSARRTPASLFGDSSHCLS